MGEAKRRKLQQRQTGGAGKINVDMVSQAVRQMVAALTNAPAADCTLYALIGAGVLRHLGVDAQPAAGSAVWRVGRGPSDVVNHASELTGQMFAQGELPAALFHAWIRVAPTPGMPGEVVDFTTFQLREKARMLDAADGGSTDVQFCPPYLWVTESRHTLDPRKVLSSFDHGVFAYVRKLALEPQIFNAEIVEQAQQWICGAVFCYEKLARGEDVQVIGIDPDGTPAVDDGPAPLPLRRVGP